MEISQLVKMNTGIIRVRATSRNIAVRLTILPYGAYSGRVGSRIFRGFINLSGHWTMMQRVNAVLNEVQP
jgi:hypothetical protein